MKITITLIIVWGTVFSTLFGFNDRTNHNTCDSYGNPFYAAGCWIADHTELDEYRNKLLGRDR